MFTIQTRDDMRRFLHFASTNNNKHFVCSQLFTCIVTLSNAFLVHLTLPLNASHSNKDRHLPRSDFCIKRAFYFAFNFSREKELETSSTLLFSKASIYSELIVV